MGMIFLVAKEHRYALWLPVRFLAVSTLSQVAILLKSPIMGRTLFIHVIYTYTVDMSELVKLFQKDNVSVLVVPRYAQLDPHLHFEVLVNTVPIPPLVLKQQIEREWDVLYGY